MQGSAIKTFAFPPKLGILASTSPNALETYIIKYILTANLPGRILKGILNPSSDSFREKFNPYCDKVALNIEPPALYILFFFFWIIRLLIS